MSYPRFSLRRLMAAVALAALVLGLIRVVPALPDLSGDGPYHSFRTVRHGWQVGPASTVAVDVFEGSIVVLPGEVGKVTAEMTLVAQSNWSLRDSEAGLQTMKLGLDQEDGVVRIAAMAGPGGGFRKECEVQLFVPPGVSLDLRTGRGSVHVGRDYKVSVPVHRPVAAASVRVRNDSKSRMGYSAGDITVETAPPPASSQLPARTRLDLDGCGRIEILATGAVVDARAWHGELPKGWTPADREDGLEGSIAFGGTLAPGDSSFRAFHDLDLDLTGGPLYEVDAEAANGVGGDLPPATTGAVKHPNRWAGRIGDGPGGRLRLRSDEGAVRLRWPQAGGAPAGR